MEALHRAAAAARPGQGQLVRRGLTTAPDAVVIGSGPNGLVAALELARAGRSVMVLERHDEIGGGTRTSALTLPGFRHDVCSAVHPGVAGSPAMRGYELAEAGLELLEPEVQAAHPFDDGTAAVLRRSVEATAEGLGEDGAAYATLLGPLVADWPSLEPILYGPPRPTRHVAAGLRFARVGLGSAAGLARARFRTPRARALLAGMAAHSMQPLEAPVTAAFGLVLLGMGHVTGWPLPRGGSQAIAAALRVRLEEHDVTIETGRTVTALDELKGARAVLFDTGPRAMAAICGGALPGRYRAALERFRYGPGVFKVDYALSGPVPWTAAACRSAGTVHLGGTLEEIAASERAVSEGRIPGRPFVLVAQPGVVDDSRAPAGRQVLWAYCHVPAGADIDMTAAIDAQVERFAPGFSELVLARAVRSPADVEADNPNYVGGDINGGAATLRQLFARPVARLDPYRTPNPRIYLCSSSTPPGGGVHGMCGWHAARAALRHALR